MAIPTGSGTEVLKHFKVHELTGSTVTLITGQANHIYTILSIFCTNLTSTEEKIDVYIVDSSVTYFLLRKQSIAPDNTFVLNDKIVLSGTQNLQTNLDTAGNVDIWGSYIEQDWS